MFKEMVSSSGSVWVSVAEAESLKELKNHIESITTPIFEAAYLEYQQKVNKSLEEWL